MRISDWSSDVCSSDRDEVRAAGRTLGGFSPELAAQERELKRFMYQNLYHHPEQLAAAEAANRVVADLFAAYAANPRLMGDDWSARLPHEICATTRHIGDYIAGMTDRFAIDRYEIGRATCRGRGRKDV